MMKYCTINLRACLFFLAFAFFSLSALAQRPDTLKAGNKKDSLNRVRDSVTSKPFVPKAYTSKVYRPDSLHSPHKAVMRSLIIPGWGQLYNHRWWKVPLVYGGLGFMGYVIINNNHYYHLYLNEANARQNGTPRNDEFKGYGGDAQQFFTAAAGEQRNFQLGILGALGVWGINVIDAFIDAKFIHSYTVDNDLSFRVSPGMINAPVYAMNNFGYIPAVKLTLAFK